MNIQKVNSVSFGEIYYENKVKGFSVTPNQRSVWPIVFNRLNPYVSNIVPSLEKKGSVDVVLFFNPDGTTMLKTKDIYDKTPVEAQNNPDFDNDNIANNIVCPRIGVKFTKRDQQTWDGITKKLNTFIKSCEKWLQDKDPNYNSSSD